VPVLAPVLVSARVLVSAVRMLVGT
jgi:hypothetical protein